jgi:hypothetical protein
MTANAAAMPIRARADALDWMPSEPGSTRTGSP